jgi:hypothetical protein
MAPELPRSFDLSFWATADTIGSPYPWGYAFNDTVPIGGGRTAPNDIFPLEAQTDVQSQFTSLLRANSPLHGVVTGCPGTCKAKMRGPALAQEVCTTEGFPMNYTQNVFVSGSKSNTVAPPFEQQLFLVSTGLVLDEDEKMWLVTGHYDGEECVGTLHRTACTMVSAVGEYDITIRANVATVDNPGNPTIVSMANNTATDHGSGEGGFPGAHPSLFAGIVQQAFKEWECVTSIDYTKSLGWQTYTVGVDTIAYRTGDNQNCSSYVDPRADVLATLNKMMLWAGMTAAKPDAAWRSRIEQGLDSGLPLTSTITGEKTGDHSIYWTEYGFFVGAALVEVFCLAVIAPIYWGWWTLGRAVSFSPLELAKAFDSSELKECNSNSTGRDIARVVGERRVRYGAVSSGPEGKSEKLMVGHADWTVTPAQGAHFV